jgi:adenylate cyclase
LPSQQGRRATGYLCAPERAEQLRDAVDCSVSPTRYRQRVAEEIERKFLLTEEPDWLRSCSATQIEQGYLAIAEEVEVRVRRAGSARFLTVKRGKGEVREEVEIALDEGQYAALWPLTESRRFSKTRRLVPLDDGLSAEVDVFEGDLEGLLVAEVEFDSVQQSRRFEPPHWMAEEVTGDDRYAGQSLALKGHPSGEAVR